jgi:hypothetical protein
MKNNDILYNEYCNKCIKKPKSFSEWLIITTEINFHKLIIRPRIIWWQNLRKELNYENYKYNINN